MVRPYRKVSADVKNGVIKRLNFRGCQDFIETESYRRHFDSRFDRERLSKNLDRLYGALSSKASNSFELYEHDLIGLSYGGGFANVLKSGGRKYLLATHRDEAATEPDLLDTASGISYGDSVRECIIGHGTSETLMFHKGTLLVPQFPPGDYRKFNSVIGKVLQSTVNDIGKGMYEECYCECSIMPRKDIVEINVFNDFYASKPGECLEAHAAFLPQFVTLNQLLQTSIPDDLDIDEISFHDHLDRQVGREVALIDLKEGSVRTSVRGLQKETYNTIPEYLETFAGPRYVTVDMASVIGNIGSALGDASAIEPLLAGYEGLERAYPRAVA